jgi:ribosomal protein L37AE/L43A|tara:strand:- start:5365 stop:5580 length:216 start_codon:yes stop_codon:yes gene_type:complete
MSASTPSGDIIPQQCHCCGQEAERLFNHASTNGLWICRDCLHLWESIGLMAEPVPTVIITDDETGTEWTIY